MSRQRGMRAAVIAALLVLAACGDDDGAAPPMPGTLLLSLTTPAIDDGGVTVQITGPGITAVQATNSTHRVFWRLVSETEARAIVIGGLQSGPLLTVQVADVNQLSEYQAAIGDVAGNDDALRTSATGYSAAFARIGVAGQR